MSSAEESALYAENTALKARVVELEAGPRTGSDWVSIYDRLKKAEARVVRLREALTETLTRWVDMANSGDAGFWDPEKEPHVIAARAALSEETP